MSKEEEQDRKELLEMIFKRLIPFYCPFKTTFDDYQLEYDIKVKSEQIQIRYANSNRDNN